MYYSKALYKTTIAELSLENLPGLPVLSSPLLSTLSEVIETDQQVQLVLDQQVEVMINQLLIPEQLSDVSVFHRHCFVFFVV